MVMSLAPAVTITGFIGNGQFLDETVVGVTPSKSCNGRTTAELEGILDRKKRPLVHASHSPQSG